jgi:hypothetical protein
MLVRGSLGLSLLLLSSCHGDVAVSPPEEQRTAVYQAPGLGPFVRMNQINAEEHFVSGVYGLEAGAWRWTGRQAVLRLQLKEAAGLKYAMKFAVPREVLAHRSPLRLRVLLNGKLWEQLEYEKDGIYDFEKPVPPDLLKPQAENLVALEVEAPLPARAGGHELGLILVQAGFQSAGGA